MTSLEADTSDTELDELEEPFDPEAERRERQAFRMRHLIAHLSQGRDWPRLFELIEQRGFLAEQADHFGGFQASGQNVESFLLPAAVAVSDWERFVRFAALGLNLRGLAEDLAVPEILRALARGGRCNLAQDLADRLPDPLRRAEARAVVAAAVGPTGDSFGMLLRVIAEDLQTAQPADDETATGRRLDSLVSVARLLGPELDALWPACMEKLVLGHEEATRVRQAVASAWLDRGDIEAPGLWDSLAVVGDSRRLLEIAPSRLADLQPEDPSGILERLRPLLGGEDEIRQRVFAVFLGRLARTQPDRALAAWERWIASEEASWSAELIEASRELLVQIDPQRLETFCSGIADATARVALWVIDLEARPDGRRADAALAALGKVRGGPERLHWSLRYVAARPLESEDEVRRQIGAIAAYLYELRYEVPARDLRLFLDLTARFQPEDIEACLEGVVWSPACRPNTLLTFARETEIEVVAHLLLERAERYAAAVSPTEAEGFQLRKELLIWATCRLCLLRGDLQALDRAVKRLLPEEEDDLRAALAFLLAHQEAADGERLRRLHAIVSGIRDSRRRLLTLLETLPPEEIQGDFLKPHSLYASVASVANLEDEIRGLELLHEVPLDLEALAQSRVRPIRESGIRLQALLRLAWHSLAFQQAFYGGRPDRDAAIEMVRAHLAIDDDARLVALTPEIAALGAERGGARAVAEFEEAARRLVRLDSVPWEDRAEALERLLAYIPPIFLETRERRGGRQAAAVLEAVAKVPLQADASAALAEIRSHWHEVMPILIATVDRLPEKQAAAPRCALRAGSSFPSPCERATIFSLCLTGPQERSLAASRLIAEVSSPAELRALAYLLSGVRPEIVPQILCRLSPGQETDEFGLRLIRNRWLPPTASIALLDSFTAPEARLEAEIWIGLASPGTNGSPWLTSLASLTSLTELDPSTPERQPWVHRLWEFDPDVGRRSLAPSVVEGLRSGGRARGEAALRLWFHAHLAPRLGRPHSDPLRLAEQAGKALRKTLELAVHAGLEGGE